MQLHLALYDPSYISHERTYWTWHSSSIPDSLLDECYYSYLIKQKPEKPEIIRSSDIYGGLLYMRDWVIAFRFYNGGRDTHGRPGRYVILTGWIKREEISAFIPVDIFSSNIFEALALSLPCPVPAPVSLDVEIKQKPLKSSLIVNDIVKEKYVFSSSDTIDSAVELFFSLNNQPGQYLLVVNITQNMYRLIIEKIEKSPMVSNAVQDDYNTELSLDSPFDLCNCLTKNNTGDLNPIGISENYTIQKDVTMNNSWTNYFNTVALLLIIILLSLIVIQQRALQSQVDVIQKELDMFYLKRVHALPIPVKKEINIQNNSNETLSSDPKVSTESVQEHQTGSQPNNEEQTTINQTDNEIFLQRWPFWRN